MGARRVDILTRVFVSLTIVLGLTVCATESIAKSRFHVSYLWHHDGKSVQDYRQKIGALLGPAVARHLRVISDGKLFGLVYWRRGDVAGAIRAAKVHTRILRHVGLPSAAAVREGHWTIVGSAGKPIHASIGPAPRPPRSTVHSNVASRDLEAAVERYIKRLRDKGRLAPDERTGWSVYDFTTGEKLVTINEDVPFQAASLIKPFIAAAFFHRVEADGLVYGPRSHRQMERMIHLSDNRSANWVMRQVGGPRAVQRILRRHYSSVFQDTRVVEYIPASGRTYRNKASAHDYSRFLYALWHDNIPGAAEIRRLMALPGPDRIFTGADALPEGTKVYNKTGSTAHLCGDMGILIVKGSDGKSYPYTVVGVIQKRRKARNYSQWIRSRGDIIRDVSSIVYRGITRRHELRKAL